MTKKPVLPNAAPPIAPSSVEACVASKGGNANVVASTPTQAVPKETSFEKAPVTKAPHSKTSTKTVSPDAKPTAYSDQADKNADDITTKHPVGFIRQYELVDRVKAYAPRVDEDVLNQAYVFSMVAHGNQTRSSGDPYYTHPISVAAILTELKADPATIVTALLHDTVEDTDVSVADIAERFGEEVARLVDGVTKLSQIEMRSEATKQAENFRKFVIAMAQDVRVLLVKLADRLHNMRTLHYLRQPEKRERIALETMEIYAPLAGRIGVQRFREELEDLSFKYLNPDAYAFINRRLEELRATEVHAVVDLAMMLREGLAERHIEGEVTSREKRAFSIWQKMQRKGHAFEDLADIYAFRVIVPTADDCYRALGIIHQQFRMIHGEFDDYVSTPKPNNYQSIHTAVLAPSTLGQRDMGQRVEIQIRSRRMHETAERGIAAHWKYKDHSSQTAKAQSIVIEETSTYDPYNWARSAVELLQHGDDPNEFLEYAKLELFQDQVFCFTPRGRVMALPAGATSLDFAYALHSDIGDEFTGAKINGRPRPVRTSLKNGDVVEILRSEQASIPDGWESLVVTGRARAGLRRRIKRMHEEDQIGFGKRLLVSDAHIHHLEMTDKAIEEALDKLGFADVNALYKAVGSMQISVATVRAAVFPGALDYEESADGVLAQDRPLTMRKASIPIEGLRRGTAIHLAPCCAPLSGERIVGLPAQKGVMVHRIDCDHVAGTDVPAEHWLDLRWRTDMHHEFVAPVKLTIMNKTGALGKVATMLGRYGADIVDVSLQNREIDFTDILVDIFVRDARHFNNILTALRTLDHVLHVERRLEEGPVRLEEVRRIPE